jgi:hypothetical protein
MPRKILTKCSRRGSTDDTLDDVVEMNLTGGDCFGHWDLRTRVEFARPWERWGAEITARWRAAFPGSRPMACYILGEIEPPTWMHEWPALRHPLRAIEGCTVRIADTGWHKSEHELAHLDALGLIDRKEWRAAERRLDERDWSYHGRYPQISRE